MKMSAWSKFTITSVQSHWLGILTEISFMGFDYIIIFIKGLNNENAFATYTRITAACVTAMEELKVTELIQNKTPLVGLFIQYRIIHAVDVGRSSYKLA